MTHPTAAPLPVPPVSSTAGNHSTRFREHMFVLKMQQAMAQRALWSSPSGVPFSATEQPHTPAYSDALARLQRDLKHGFENLEAMVQTTNLKLEALLSFVQDSSMPPLVSITATTTHEAADDDLPEMPPLVDHEGRLFYLDGRIETPVTPASCVVAEVMPGSSSFHKPSSPVPTCGNVGCIAAEHSSVLKNAVEQHHPVPEAPESDVEDGKMDDDDVSDAETENTLPAGSSEDADADADADTETFDEPTASSPKASGWADDEWELGNDDRERVVYPGSSRRLWDRTRKSSSYKDYGWFRKPDDSAQLSEDGDAELYEDGDDEEDPELRIGRIQVALLEAKLKLAKKELEIAQRRDAESSDSSMDEENEDY